MRAETVGTGLQMGAIGGPLVMTEAEDDARELPSGTKCDAVVRALVIAEHIAGRRVTRACTWNELDEGRHVGRGSTALQTNGVIRVVINSLQLQ